MNLLKTASAAVLFAFLGATSSQAGVASSAATKACVAAVGEKKNQDAKLGDRLALAECEFNGSPAETFGADDKQTRITFLNPDWCADAKEGEPLKLVSCKSVTTQWKYDPKSKAFRSNSGLCWEPIAVNGRYPKGSGVKAAKCTGARIQQFENE